MGYFYSDECLEHHGIKGQKWGVRRFQNKDGSLKTAGKKRYNENAGNTEKRYANSARKFVTGNLDSHKKFDELGIQRENEINKIKRPKDDEWYNEKTGWTDKAKQYMSKVDKIDEKYRKKERSLYKEMEKERDNVRKDVLLNDDIKTDTLKARGLNKQIESLRDEILGENSANATKAYKQYLKENPDSGDAEYGFFHYKWRPGNEAYDKCEKEYQQKAGELQKQYESTVKSIGKKIIDAAGDTKLSDIKVNTDFVEFEINQIISFRDEYFNETNKV